MAKLVVIGAGAMGLAAAHYALNAGHEVDLVEADRVVGGMAAHFDFGGISVERFYHFICTSDHATFALMNELGINDKMRWRRTSMGYFIGKKIHPWGDPIALLKFPHLSWVSKFRTGLQMFLTTKSRNFDHLEHVSTKDWIIKGSGQAVYDTLWRRLMDLKFYEYAANVSAAWIATRVKRIGNSRSSIFAEKLGYIEGGSETLVKTLETAIVRRGGRIHLATPAEKVETRDGKVTGVTAGGRHFPADAVISTVPTPFITTLVPDLPETSRSQYAAIDNIGVVCLLLKLKKSVSTHFWLNVVDETMPIPGIIEFSNLRPMPETVVFVPYYMPVSNPKFGRADQEFITEAYDCLRRINPDLAEDDLIEASVGRLKYAQPICEPGFAAKLPPVQTPIAGLQIADTCFYYPEDRGISESIRIAKEMVERL